MYRYSIGRHNPINSRLNMWRRNPGIDEEIRNLERDALTGDEVAYDRLHRVLERTGQLGELPRGYRIFEAPYSGEGNVTLPLPEYGEPGWVLASGPMRNWHRTRQEAIDDGVRCAGDYAGTTYWGKFSFSPEGLRERLLQNWGPPPQSLRRRRNPANTCGNCRTGNREGRDICWKCGFDLGASPAERTANIRRRTEARMGTGLRRRNPIYTRHNPKEFEPEFSTSNSLIEDINHGYANKEALKITKQLSSEDQQRLAAMAMTWYFSGWSDRDRDLLRGIYSVTKIAPRRNPLKRWNPLCRSHQELHAGDVKVGPNQYKCGSCGVRFNTASPRVLKPRRYWKHHGVKLLRGVSATTERFLR